VFQCCHATAIMPLHLVVSQEIFPYTVEYLTVTPGVIARPHVNVG
jgi:hypothetical protein